MAKSRDKLEQLADLIAEQLFTDSFGGKAERLVLIHRDSAKGAERMGSSWSYKAVVNVIFKRLRAYKVVEESRIKQLREERNAMKGRAEAAEEDWQLAEAEVKRLKNHQS